MSISRKMFDDFDSFCAQPNMNMNLGLGVAPQARGGRMFDIIGGLRNDILDQVRH